MTAISRVSQGVWRYDRGAEFCMKSNCQSSAIFSSTIKRAVWKTIACVALAYSWDNSLSQSEDSHGQTWQTGARRFRGFEFVYGAAQGKRERRAPIHAKRNARSPGSFNRHRKSRNLVPSSRAIATWQLYTFIICNVYATLYIIH